MQTKIDGTLLHDLDELFLIEAFNCSTWNFQILFLIKKCIYVLQSITNANLTYLFLYPPLEKWEGI